MASLSTSLSFIPPNPSPSTVRRRRPNPVRCGPRSNRGPLVKGRILSIEAIHAVQSLKRSHRTAPTDPTHITKTLSRLIRADLIAVFKELLRQDRCDLALKILPTVRSECEDLAVYADLITALARTGMNGEIEELISGIEGCEVVRCDDKGVVRLVRALVESEEIGAAARVYEAMKRSGLGERFVIDEYVGKVLRSGFVRAGMVELAEDVDRELQRVMPRLPIGKL